ncbi:MAG: Bac transf protein [Candidatus Magasanikbacteria bacterium]|nr:Bac transf protein [Candidatus Magasanikbacteria bacterium]
MKRSELIFTALLLPIDFLALLAAGALAYFLRFAPLIVGVRQVRFTLTFEQFFPVVALTALGWMIIFALNGLYSIDPNRKFAAELSKIFFGSAVGLAAITIYSFFRAELFNSRFIVLAAWALAIITVSLGHLLVRLLKLALASRGIGTRHVVVIGADKLTDYFLKTLRDRKALGYTVTAHYPIFNEAVRNEILKLHEKLGVDEIILTSPKKTEEETLAVMDFCDEHHFGFKYSADLFSTFAPHLSVSTIADIPVVEFKKTALDGWGKIVKRVIDIFVSGVLLIILSPVLLIIALIIKIESGSPVIFKNERVGEQGKIFNALKFRTMLQKFSIGKQFPESAEALKYEKELIEKQSIKVGPIYKIKNDPRVTKFGKILRRWSLDEWPQLWNVLKGQMSLVGPRPHQTREVEKYERRHKRVHTIKPGITGMAQISGRSDLEFEEEIRLDTFYMENWSLLMDAFILLKTPWAVIRGRKAL